MVCCLEVGEIMIVFDDMYDFYLNNCKFGFGCGMGYFDKYDVFEFLLWGCNVIVIKVENCEGVMVVLVV